MAAVTGTAEAVAGFLDGAELPPDAEVLGPIPVPSSEAGRPRRAGGPPPGEHWVRALIRVPPGSGAALAFALKTALAARTARGGRAGGETVRIRIDPPDIG
jgi:primosomal protein N' (replication factor Y)